MRRGRNADSQSPEELLGWARDLVARPDPSTAGLWPRASAFLARQALERALAVLWGQRAHGLEACPMRAQLLCLGNIIADPELASQTEHTWGFLTRACHHHPYELQPTAFELADCFADVERLLAEVRRCGAVPLAPKRSGVDAD